MEKTNYQLVRNGFQICMENSEYPYVKTFRLSDILEFTGVPHLFNKRDIEEMLARVILLANEYQEVAGNYFDHGYIVEFEKYPFSREEDQYLYPEDLVRYLGFFHSLSRVELPFELWLQTAVPLCDSMIDFKGSFDAAPDEADLNGLPHFSPAAITAARELAGVIAAKLDDKAFAEWEKDFGREAGRQTGLAKARLNNRFNPGKVPQERTQAFYAHLSRQGFSFDGEEDKAYANCLMQLIWEFENGHMISLNCGELSLCEEHSATMDIRHLPQDDFYVHYWGEIHRWKLLEAAKLVKGLDFHSQTGRKPTDQQLGELWKDLWAS